MTTGKPIAQLDACMRLLRWVHDDCRVARAKVESPAVTSTRTEIEKVHRLATDRHLDTLLDPRNPVGNMGDYWIHGRKVFGSDKPWVIPAMTFRWNFTSSPTLRILVVLVAAKEFVSGDKSGYTTTAFRFENGEPGPHDFHHAQPNLSTKRAGVPILGTTPPMSESSPAFPLDARGPVGITMCVLASLYAGERIRTKVLADAGLRTALAPFVSELPAVVGPSAVRIQNTVTRSPASAPPPTGTPSTSSTEGQTKQSKIPKPGPPPGYRPPSSP